MSVTVDSVEDLVRDMMENAAKYGGENTTTLLMVQAIEALKFLAAAQQAVAESARIHALENVALLADILNRRPAMNADLMEAYGQWTNEVYQLMGAMAAEPANDAVLKGEAADVVMDAASPQAKKGPAA